MGPRPIHLQFTAAVNAASQRLMERLGLIHDPSNLSGLWVFGIFMGYIAFRRQVRSVTLAIILGCVGMLCLLRRSRSYGQPCPWSGEAAGALGTPRDAILFDARTGNQPLTLCAHGSTMKLPLIGPLDRARLDVNHSRLIGCADVLRARRSHAAPRPPQPLSGRDLRVAP